MKTGGIPALEFQAINEFECVQMVHLATNAKLEQEMIFKIIAALQNSLYFKLQISVLFVLHG